MSQPVAFRRHGLRRINSIHQHAPTNHQGEGNDENDYCFAIHLEKFSPACTNSVMEPLIVAAPPRTSDGHRIVPAVAPGMAATNPSHRQPASAKRAMLPDCLQRVGRTARREPATPQRAKQNRLSRRNHPAIDAHSKNQNVLGWVHGSLSNLALRIADKKSRSTSARCLPTMDKRATSTIVTGCRKSC